VTFARLSPLVQEPERMSNQRPRLRDERPKRTAAFNDAVEQDLAHAQLRLIPWVSSWASGSPALLP
jgi:hypothetical protein